MEYTNISFSKTIQTAQFEPEVFEVHATLESGDDLQECAAKLKSEVTAALTGKTASTTKKASAEKKTDKKAAADKKKTAGKKKDIPYDRSVKAHKTDFGKILLEIAPTWQKDADLKAKAKGLSESMDGKAMYSGEGDILDSFKEEIAIGLKSEEDDL